MMGNGITSRVCSALVSGIGEIEAERRSPQRDLWRAALRLEHVILSDLLTDEEQEATLSGMEPGRRRICQEIFCGLETTIENSFAALALDGNEALIGRTDSISENYLARYEAMARREIAFAGIRERDRVLFIGSGPFPITGIEYSRQTGCHVDCVDFVAEAVDTSRSVLRKLGMSDRIRCHQARGECFPASEYSVVLVGVLARPKRAIFTNLEATCPEGCRIIARTTFGLRELVYEPVEFETTVPRGLRRDGRSEARGDQVISSILYVKGR